MLTLFHAPLPRSSRTSGCSRSWVRPFQLRARHDPLQWMEAVTDPTPPILTPTRKCPPSSTTWHWLPRARRWRPISPTCCLGWGWLPASATKDRGTYLTWISLDRRGAWSRHLPTPERWGRRTHACRVRGSAPHRLDDALTGRPYLLGNNLALPTSCWAARWAGRATSCRQKGQSPPIWHATWPGRHLREPWHGMRLQRIRAA